MSQNRTVEYALEKAGLGPVAGVDEAGRGACAGPISIAACILPSSPIPELEMLTDSKKLTPLRREKLYPILKDVALAWSVVHISAAEIDRRGINNANYDGMRRAVAQLEIKPGYVLSDAVAIPGLTQPHMAMIKGDSLCRSISAASVLAKVSRDHYMMELAEQYPCYSFEKHKGYGTTVHIDAVSLHGACPEHRYTYQNVAKAQKTFEQR